MGESKKLQTNSKRYEISSKKTFVGDVSETFTKLRVIFLVTNIQNYPSGIIEGGNISEYIQVDIFVLCFAKNPCKAIFQLRRDKPNHRTSSGNDLMGKHHKALKWDWVFDNLRSLFTGIDFKQKLINLDGVPIKLQIWDVSLILVDVSI